MPTQTIVLLAVAGAFVVAVIVMLTATFFTVEQRSTAIVQRLGKFLREAGPGLHTKIPFVDKVMGRVNLRVQQLDVEIETNGLMTYDRAVCKMEPAEAARAAQGYVPPVLVSGEQVFIETADVALASANGKGEVYYTLDGSEPTKDSMKYERPIHLSETATIKARCFWDGGRQSEVVEFSIRREEPPEAVISEGGP